MQGDLTAARHPDAESDLDSKLKAQVGGLLLVPFYVVILAWVLKALGLW